MTVYLDVLFGINLFVNYYLLKLTGRFAQRGLKRWRSLLAAAAGGVYATVIFFPVLSFFESFVFKIAMAGAIILIAFGWKEKYIFLRCWLIFLIASFLLGGILTGIYYILAPPHMHLNNSIVYFHISPLLLLLSVTAVYLFVCLLTPLIRSKTISEQDHYQVTICYRRRSIQTSGYVDTGNSLVDLFSDTPVIICSYHIISQLMTDTEKKFFQTMQIDSSLDSVPVGIRLIPAGTVHCQGILPAFQPDYILLRTPKAEQRIDRVFVAVTTQFAESQRDAVLLNPQLISTSQRS